MVFELEDWIGVSEIIKGSESYWDVYFCSAFLFTMVSLFKIAFDGVPCIARLSFHDHHGVKKIEDRIHYLLDYIAK